MIKNLRVKNFKSIKNLEIECKRVNIFLGKPNTGKSNILESLGIFSLPYVRNQELRNLIRLEAAANLLYDNELSENVVIQADNFSCSVKFENGNFIVVGKDNEEDILSCILDYGGYRHGGTFYSSQPPFKFYRFQVLNRFERQAFSFLIPPNGENLLSILLTNKTVRELTDTLLREYGLRLVLEPQEFKINIQKEVGGVLVSHPYSLMSDTLQRIIFYLVAIETNKDSILIFEEPEAHAFPFYTKHLAERIAFNSSNQYFLSTHNPYLIFSLLEKTPKEDLNVFITYFADYQTRAKLLDPHEIEKIMNLGTDIFFNIDQFLEK